MLDMLSIIIYPKLGYPKIGYYLKRDITSIINFMDKVTPDQRSWNMSKIKSKDTLPELRVRKTLTDFGFRYRLHVKTLPGKPDIVLNKYKTAVFVNGCFWHQHKKCKRASMPKTNLDYWKHKLEVNVSRQKIDLIALKDLGWNSLIIWECQTIQSDKLLGIIKSSSLFSEKL